MLKRTLMKRRYRQTGPDVATRLLVQIRAAGRCERCSDPLDEYQLHHRRPRRMGGSRRPDTNQAQNLVAICPGCHREVESRRAEAIAHGWLLYADDNPADRPILLHNGSRWAYLTPDGDITDQPPREGTDG